MELTLLGTLIEIDEERLGSGRRKVLRQLDEYRCGVRKNFQLGVKYPDNFRGEVMQELRRIPYGETRTYGQIAEELDSAPVAVGRACSNNPVPVVVPCHRVVGKDSLGGYQYGQLKKKLLALEKSLKSSQQDN
ncbi:MAG: methylated-DNA--[protein]-cysteine S-methyltransferase [Candidatus Nanohaloarchaea archaeon]